MRGRASKVMTQHAVEDMKLGKSVIMPMGVRCHSSCEHSRSSANAVERLKVLSTLCR